MPFPFMAAASMIPSIMGMFGSKGKKAKNERVPLYSAQQMAFQDYMLQSSQKGMGQSMDYLNKIMSDDPTTMSAFEAPFKQQFEEQTMPAIAERFAGMNAQGSSAFGQSLSQAGAGLSENLAALRANLKGQAMSQLQSFAGMGLQQQYQNMYSPETGGNQQGAGMMAGAMGSAGMSHLMDWMQTGSQQNQQRVQPQGRPMVPGSRNPMITGGYGGGRPMLGGW